MEQEKEQSLTDKDNLKINNYGFSNGDKSIKIENNGVGESEESGNAVEKPLHFDDNRDSTPNIMDKLGDIDSNLQALQEDLQNNTDSRRIGNEEIVTMLNRVQEDLRGIKNAVRIKMKDGRERGVVNLVSEMLNNIRDILGKLAKPAATAEGLQKYQADVINKIIEVRNSIKNDLRNDIKYDLRNELNGKIREMRSGVEQIAQGLKGGLNQELAKISGNIKKLQTGQETIAKFVEEEFQTTLKQELKPLKALETTSGQLGQLKEGIDAVSQTLSDKGLQLRQKFPAANANEEVLCNLTEYGHTIITQLSVAARWYARSKAELDNLETIKRQSEKEYSRGYTEGESSGQAKGRHSLIKELFDRFGDGEALLLDKREGFDPMAQLGILADFLQSEGLRHGYTPGEVVEVSEDNYDELTARIKDLPHASVRITKSDYYLDDELLQRAECIPLSQPTETLPPPLSDSSNDTH